MTSDCIASAPLPSPVLKFARLSLACLVAYWLVLALATHCPVPGGRPDGPKIDKPLHEIAFFVLALCACWAWGTRKRLTLRLLLLVGAMLLAYGVVDEITQAPIPRRTPALDDWLADVLGVAAGLALWWFAPRRWKAALGDRYSRERSAATSPGSKETAGAAGPGN